MGVDSVARVPGGPTVAEPRTGADVVETHVSILFFVGDRVYKLRKPVRFGFLDFTDRVARQEDCRREVALNRRLAPDVYLGVADVQFNGEAIDHMVVMRRLPAERRLAAMARRGDELGEWLGKVAQTMESFHRTARRSPEVSAVATGAALQASWEANFCESAPFVGSILEARVDDEIRALASRFIGGRTPLFDARIAAGRVCDGHGDLQAEDIFCMDDGVRILDCVEFSDALRFGDVCADVAFLAMDLERLGRAAEAKQFLNAYQELAGDPFPDSLLHHYVALRAYVRAKVACLRVGQGDGSARAEAGRLHRLAMGHLRQAQVRLVLVGGLPGTGKSTVAAGVGRQRGWKVLRSDAIRRGMFVAEEGEVPGYGLGRYAQGATASVYSQLLERAGALLARGESVVLDASWIDARRREAAQALASRTGSALVEVWCQARADVAETRLVHRLSEGLDVSEATPDVRSSMSAAMDPWASAVVVDTTEVTADESIARVLEVLRDS